MSLVTLLLILVVVGAVLYAFNQIAPVDPKVKTIVNVLVMLVLFLLTAQWILATFFPGALDWRPTPVVKGHR